MSTSYFEPNSSLSPDRANHYSFISVLAMILLSLMTFTTVNQLVKGEGDHIEGVSNSLSEKQNQSFSNPPGSYTRAMAGSGSLLLTKMATYEDNDASGTVTLGDSVVFMFTVENNGTEDVSDVVVIDPLVGGLFTGYDFTGAFTGSGVNYGLASSFNGSPFFTGSGVPLFSPGAVGSMKVKYPLSAVDIENGYVLNTATVEGSCPGGPVSSMGSAVVSLPNIMDINIADPCNCADPLNTKNGAYYYFHERVILSGAPGVQWQVDPSSVGIYNAIGSPMGAINIPEILAESGVYQLDFWVRIGQPYNFVAQLTGSPLGITRSIGGLCTEVCDCDPSAPSPSLACPGKINMTLGPNCYATFDPFDISMANGVRLEISFYDKKTGRIIGDTLRKEHVGQEIAYRATDPCSGTHCWGDINLELKLEPQIVTSARYVMCGENYPELLSLTQLGSYYNSTCFLPLSNLRDYIRTVGDKCETTFVIRTVLGDSYLHDIKKTHVLRIDTIGELPITRDMITCPIGSSIFDDPLEIACNKIDGYPTPAKIEALLGVQAAYPHVDKGEVVTSRNVVRQVITERIEPRELIVNGIAGIYNVIVKDTTSEIFVEYDTAYVALAIKEGQFCNLAVKYDDENFESCSGPLNKIKRTWTILDWCSGMFYECEQFITIVDKTPPVIKKTEDIYVDASPWTCIAEAQLTGSATDDCSSVSYRWNVSHGAVDSAGRLTGITLLNGRVTVELLAIDACGNIARDTFFVHILDKSAPVAISKDELIATIIPGGIDGGTVKVTVDNVDAGSHDSGCGDITRCLLLPAEWENPIINPRTGRQATDEDGNLLYRAAQCDHDGIFVALTINGKDTVRQSIPYVICKDFVKFCCKDIGTNRVLLVVNDNSPHSPAGVSWTNIIVENKLAPLVTCPAPITVRCGQKYEIPRPVVIEGPCGNEGLEYSLLEDIDGCGAGKIEVIWTYNGKVVCRSLINVVNDNAFDPTSIRWPLHHTGESLPGLVRECVVIGKDANGKDIYDIEAKAGLIDQNDNLACVGSVDDKPVWCDSHCSLAVASYQDTEVVAGEACKKIIRRWTVIDWCTYKPNSGADANEDDVELIDDQWITEDSKCETCEKYKGERKDVYFRYTSNVKRDGYYTFDQVIKIVDDTPPSIFADETFEVPILDGATSKDDNFNNCKASGIVTAYVSDLCGEAALDPSTIRWVIRTENSAGQIIAGPKTATGGTATMTTGVGGIKDIHFIRWEARDGCGNVATLRTTVLFVDKQKPTPLCISDLSTATMSTDGSATIWAEDFDRGSYDNCSAVKVYFKDAQGNATSSLTFTCADIPNGRVAVKDIRLFVADEAGNEEFCFVRLRIDDNADVCPDVEVGAALIAGELRTSEGHMIESAEVRLGESRVHITGVEGKYAFEELDMESTYQISGYRNDNPLNGVSTLDLVIIQRHILANKLLDDPYKVIAADVNGDGRVSAIDLIEIRQLLLGKLTNFRNSPSWRFVNASQTFANTNRPWPFIEHIMIDPLRENMEDQDFIGVKIGDVSGNAIANSTLKSRTRSGNDLRLATDDIMLKKGEIISLPFEASNWHNIAALQGTINTDNLEVVGIEGINMPIGEEHYAKIDDNTTTIAWYNMNGITFEGYAFEIVVRAKKDVMLSKAMSITSGVTEAAAYTDEGQEWGVSLQFNRSLLEENAAEILLGQNTPNPFKDETVIPFTLTESGRVTITVTDITGKLVYKHHSLREKGFNTLRITQDEINSTGLLYYHLDVDGQRLSQKMIRLD